MASLSAISTAVPTADSISQMESMLFGAAATTTSSTSSTIGPHLATGSLDPSHTSTISITYSSYPTPWPLLLMSILITLFLGHIGWASAFRSWHPHVDIKRLMPQRGTAEYVELQAKIPQKGSNQTPSEWDAAALQDAQLYLPSDDTKPHGGVGYGRMVLTLFGAGWTTLRVIFTFALVLSATVKTDSSLPDPWSVIALLIVCQIYMSSRGFPRAINLLMAFNIALMGTATILSTWGPRANTNYYAKMVVTGGNCPFFWHEDCPLTNYTPHINSNMTVLGCQNNNTWDQAAEGYPRGAYWDATDSPDPNRFSEMYHNRTFVKYAGLILAIFTLLWTLYMVIRTRPWKEMRYPLPELKMARFGSFANQMGHISYLFMLIFILWALLGHIFDELLPNDFVYVDSFGPAVNTSVFTAVPRSLGWNQSHDGGDTFEFLGGNATTWSDCFTISPEKSASGHIVEWWGEKESKALRVLAQL